MRFALTSDLLTHFLDHVVVTSDSGSADTVLRGRALGAAQRCVDQYWEFPWKHRERSDALSFNSQGIADLPAKWGWWERDFGYIVWGSPYLRLTAPPEEQVREVMAARTKYPTRTGPPQAVVMHAQQLKRWPTVPVAVPEAATIFYHRTGPDLVDAAAVTYSAGTISAASADNSFNDSGAAFPVVAAGDIIVVSGFAGSAASALANNKEHVVISRTASKIVVGSTLVTDAAGETVTIDLPVDEWTLIPEQDQMVILDGMRAAWDVNSGDGREPAHEQRFRQRCAALYRARNQNQQPRRLGRPFRSTAGAGAYPRFRWTES